MDGQRNTYSMLTNPGVSECNAVQEDEMKKRERKEILESIEKGH